MGIYTLNDYVLGSRFKKSRTKKRLVKKDFDKNLIQINKKENLLYKKRKDLPLELLEKPYQQGWVRFFVVREDVKRSNDYEFYETLLNKINTYTFSNTKDFKKSKRKYRKRIYVDREQFLKKVSLTEWNCPKLGLTLKEKAMFTLTHEWNHTFKRYLIYYRFDESWRYVLKIRPNIITHRQSVDVILEQEISEIKNYIERNNLRHKISKLTMSYVKYKDYYNLNFKHQDPLKNKSEKEIYQQYIDEKF
jgi:hypothetical protein